MNAFEKILALDALHVGVLRDLGRFEESAAALPCQVGLSVQAVSQPLRGRPQLCEDARAAAAGSGLENPPL